jgi:hypothetical protein
MAIKCNTELDSSKLLKVITEIWQNNGISREGIVSFVKEFDQHDWLALASIDSVSLWGPNSGTFVFHENKVTVMSKDGNVSKIITMVSCNNINTNNYIQYGEFSKCFNLEGLAEVVNIVNRDVVDVLELLSYLYFHVDSIVMLPPELRQQRLSSITKNYNLPVFYLTNMINWLPEIK